MTIILGILFGFTAICTVMMILLQEGKGGGISAMGVAGMDRLVGARNPLRKLTVIFSVAFILLLLGLNYAINTSSKDKISDGLEELAPAVTATESTDVADTVAAPAEEESNDSVASEAAPEETGTDNADAEEKTE